MNKIKPTKRNSWINNQIKAHRENKINDSSDFPSVCEIEKNSIYYLNSFDIVDNDPTKTNTGMKFANPGYIAWDFEKKEWLNVGLGSNAIPFTETLPPKLAKIMASIKKEAEAFEKKNGHPYFDKNPILPPPLNINCKCNCIGNPAVKKRQKNHSTKIMILLLLIGLIFILLYSCSHGYLKQDIRGIFKPIIYVLKINHETLKSDKTKLQHLLKKLNNQGTHYEQN